MKRTALFLAVFLAAGALPSQTVPELFQKAKAQVRGGGWQDALKTLAAVDAEAAKPGNEGMAQQLEGPVAFYRAVCEANLDQPDKATADFATFLRAQPNATIDPGTYSKKAVAAFDDARKIVAPPPSAGSGAPSLFNAYQEFKPPANISEPANEKWADGPVQWIMTADEKISWSQLSTGGERVEFVEKFWEARNPKPGTGDNTFRTGFERRAAFADAHFVQDEKKRGSLTDRGMVFVLLGPPTYGGRRPIKAGEDTAEAAGMSSVGSADSAIAQQSAMAAAPSGKLSSGQAATISDRFSGPGTQAAQSDSNYREVWHYRKELLPRGVSYLQVDVTFVNKKGYGVNVLQREPQTLATLAAAKKKPE
jgi:GWxTD domain-containing protein